MRYFSPSTLGFYSEGRHGSRKIQLPDSDELIDNLACTIPADAVEVSEEVFTALLEGNSTGRTISADINGYPILVAQPEPTTEQVIARYEAALDARLDAVAQADRWRDRFTFAVRAGYENPWQTKAKAFGTWMDECNVQAYALLAAVTAGTAELPTVEDFIAAMPPAPVLQ